MNLSKEGYFDWLIQTLPRKVIVRTIVNINGDLEIFLYTLKSHSKIGATSLKLISIHYKIIDAQYLHYNGFENLEITEYFDLEILRRKLAEIIKEDPKLWEDKEDSKTALIINSSNDILYMNNLAFPYIVHHCILLGRIKEKLFSTPPDSEAYEIIESLEERYSKFLSVEMNKNPFKIF